MTLRSPTSFFRLKLKQLALKDDGGESSDSDPGDAPPRALLNVPGALPLLPPVVLGDRVPWHMTEWRRCWVTYLDTNIKVWFDNCCGAGGIRRGWSNCSTHRCGNIRPVVGSRDFFVCAMALWHRHGYGDAGMTRADHMGFWPEHDAIVAALPVCTFENF